MSQQKTQFTRTPQLQLDKLSIAPDARRSTQVRPQPQFVKLPLVLQRQVPRVRHIAVALVTRLLISAAILIALYLFVLSNWQDTPTGPPVTGVAVQERGQGRNSMTVAHTKLVNMIVPKASAEGQYSVWNDGTWHIWANIDADPQFAVGYWAGVYGISWSWIDRIVRCESGYDPTAVNSIIVNDGHGDEHAQGLAQFLPSTFYYWRQILNSDTQYVAGDRYEGRDIFSVGAEAHVMAYMLYEGQAYQWVCQ